MLYFLEIFYRVFYIVWSLFFTFLIILLNKSSGLFLLSYLSTFDFDQNKILTYNIDKVIVLRSPFDLFDIDFSYSITITTLFVIPFIFWNVFFFFSSVLNRKNKNKISFLLLSFTSKYYLLNYFVYSKLFVFFWDFLECIVTQDISVYYLNIDYDLNMQYFVLILGQFLFFFNLFFIFFFLFLLYINELNLKSYFLKKRVFLIIISILILLNLLTNLNLFSILITIFILFIFSFKYYEKFFVISQSIKFFDL